MCHSKTFLLKKWFIKKKPLSRYFIVFTFIGMPSLLAGCATVQNYQSTVNTWQGHNKRQLVKRWGLPDREMKLPDGQAIYVYRARRKVSGLTQLASIAGQAYVTRSSLKGSGRYATCTTYFDVNASGKITNTRFQGGGCQAGRQFKSRYSAL